jgi:hypothetical protein
MFKEIGDSHFSLQTKKEQGYYLIDGMLRGRVSTKVPFIGCFFPSCVGHRGESCKCKKQADLWIRQSIKADEFQWQRYGPPFLYFFRR